MKEIIKVSVQLDERKVTIEGPRDFVEAEVRRISDTLTGASGGAKASADPTRDVDVDESEKDFLAAKKPKGHLETVAVLAFFLAQHGQEEFTEEDIRKAYIRAAVRPPKVVAQSIRDAKRYREFIQTGSAKGKYRLTHHGDRFVRFDLGKDGPR